MRSVAIITLLGTLTLWSCKNEQNAPPSTHEGGASLYSRPTTSGHIAVNNLNAQLRGITKSAELNPRVLQFQSKWADLLSLRADFTGSYEDFDDLVEIAQRAVETHPKDANAYLLRAGVNASLHRFDDALADYDRADELGAPAHIVEKGRSGVWIATATHLEEAYNLRKARADAAPTYETLTALAIAETALGRYADADASYERALDLYADSSPFAVAWVFFQRGAMWAEKAGEPERSRAFYQEAVRRLPRYTRANVHLAEMEVAAGERERAIERLRDMSSNSYDPEPTGYLGQLLAASRDKEKKKEGQVLIDRAKDRYELLLSKYPEAFADHAVEFYLGPGADAERAYELATLNLANRNTDRALGLALRAADAAQKNYALCELAKGARNRTVHVASVADTLNRVRTGCSQ